MLLLFGISASLLLLFELLGWALIMLHRNAPPKATPPVSILIAAHDEKKALERNLPSVFACMRDGDELVIVDDGSQDGSFEFLRELCAERPLVLVHNHTRQGKKRSIDIGCGKATHEYILQTDADCRPRSEDWIDRMRGPIAQGKELVLGWGAIRSRGRLIGAFSCWEGARTAFTYSTFALLRIPYMGVGRNLLYHRSLRDRKPMPDAYYRSMSGDDDLLVAHRADPDRTSVQMDPKAHTLSDPPSTWGGYWHQRRRHAEAGLHYPLNRKIPLGILDLNQVLFVLLALALILSRGSSSVLVAFILIPYLQGSLMIIGGKGGIGGSIMAFSPLFTFMSTMKRIFVDVSVLLSKPTRWQ